MLKLSVPKVSNFWLVLRNDVRLLSTKPEKIVKDPEARKILDRILRVDHAGEFGANRIYAGQMAVLGKTDVGSTIQHMWDQEKGHLKEFEKILPQYRVRPTALLPLWSVAGYVLGMGTALMSKEAAMACTVAVEDVISEHYNNQLRELLERDPELYKDLLQIIKKFRDEEMEHHDTGLEHNAEKAAFYKPLTEVIKAGCKAAVWVAERV